MLINSIGIADWLVNLENARLRGGRFLDKTKMFSKENRREIRIGYEMDSDKTRALNVLQIWRSG